MPSYLIGPTEALFQLNREIGQQLWSDQWYIPIDFFCDHPELRHHWQTWHGTKIGDESTARFMISDEIAQYIPTGEYSYSYDLLNYNTNEPVHYEGTCTFTTAELELEDPEWYVKPGETLGGGGLYSVTPLGQEEA